VVEHLPHHPKVEAGNTILRGRLSTVALLNKVACFVKHLNNIFIIIMKKKKVSLVCLKHLTSITHFIEALRGFKLGQRREHSGRALAS
jgi:hypothetical protein